MGVTTKNRKTKTMRMRMMTRKEKPIKDTKDEGLFLGLDTLKEQGKTDDGYASARF